MLAALLENLHAAGIGAGYSPVTVAALAAAVTVVVAYTAPRNDEQAAGGPPVPEDALQADYDAAFVAAYWARRPGAVAVRSLQVLMAAMRVGSGLLLDTLLTKCGQLPCSQKNRVGSAV